jgi:hypothetical protein
MFIFVALSHYILADISYMQYVIYVQECQNLGKVFLSNIWLVSYFQFVVASNEYGFFDALNFDF